jgi:hypothetical protein
MSISPSKPSVPRWQQPYLFCSPLYSLCVESGTCSINICPTKEGGFSSLGTFTILYSSKFASTSLTFSLLQPSQEFILFPLYPKDQHSPKYHPQISFSYFKYYEALTLTLLSSNNFFTKLQSHIFNCTQYLLLSCSTNILLV